MNASAAVAQKVEREKTGLDKDLNSNTYHLSSALSRVRFPSRQKRFECFPVKSSLTVEKQVLEKTLTAMINWFMWVQILPR